MDCRADRSVDLYVLRSQIWLDAGLDGRDPGFLCAPCIEKRLGRQLQKKDLLAWSTKT